MSGWLNIVLPFIGGKTEISRALATYFRLVFIISIAACLFYIFVYPDISQNLSARFFEISLWSGILLLLPFRKKFESLQGSYAQHKQKRYTYYWWISLGYPIFCGVGAVYLIAATRSGAFTMEEKILGIFCMSYLIAIFYQLFISSIFWKKSFDIASFYSIVLVIVAYKIYTDYF